jgi:hypothetical protein
MAKKAAKKPAAADKKKETEKPIMPDAFTRGKGIHAHMTRRYKGNMKKADSSFSAICDHWRKTHKCLKGKDQMTRDFATSTAAALHGKNWKNDGHMAHVIGHFAKNYHSFLEKKAKAMTLKNETEVTGNVLAEKKMGRLKALGKAIGDETGIGPRSRSTSLYATRGQSMRDYLGGAAITTAGAAAAGAITGMPGTGAAIGAAIGLGGPIVSKYRHLRKYGEDVEMEAFIGELLTEGYTEEDIEALIVSEEARMEEYAKLLQAIVEGKPHDAKEAFESAIVDKLQENVEGYKSYLASSIFGGVQDEDDETDEEEVDEDEVVEELNDIDLDDIDLDSIDLDSLTDEELAELADIYGVDEETDEETDEDESDEEYDASSVDEGKRLDQMTSRADSNVGMKGLVRRAAVAGKAAMRDRADAKETERRRTTYKGDKMKRMPNGDKC